MIYLIPLLISLALGFFALRLIFPVSVRPSFLLQLFLGTTLGIFLSVFIGFTSLLFLSQFNAPYVIGIHVALFILLILVDKSIHKKDPLLSMPFFDKTDLLILLVAGLLTIPVILHANLYPYGGWDAWSCWNMKARFIFLGGEDWKNMFDPVLWRSNIAYPFLLPLASAWLWCFNGSVDPLAPRILTCLVPFLTIGLLAGILRAFTKEVFALLAPVWIFSLIFVIKLASSQYSDHVVGLYFMSLLGCFFLFNKTQARGWLILTGLFLGALSFSKSEGLVLALISGGFISLSLLTATIKGPGKKANIMIFVLFAALALIPTVLFQLLLAPDSHTFVNGLTSAEKPTSLARLLITATFFGIEFTSLKWMGFWILALAVALANFRRAFLSNLVIAPLIIITYLLIVGGVYYINTFFEIIWWLSTTLNRIIFALIPAVTLWAFASTSEK